MCAPGSGLFFESSPGAGPKGAPQRAGQEKVCSPRRKNKG